MDSKENIEDDCNNDVFCQTATNLKNDDCNYSIKSLKMENFGAEVSGLVLG